MLIKIKVLISPNQFISMQTLTIEQPPTGLQNVSDDRHIYHSVVSENNNRMTTRQMIADLEPLNAAQEKLYFRVRNGLRSLDEEESIKMSHREKALIKENFIKTRHIMNLLKQEVCIELTNHIFTALFPKTQITKELTGKFTEEKDSNFRFEILTMKDLKIERVTIIDRLIKEGILPKNFYELQ